MSKKDTDQRSSFVGHLTELRTRLIRSFLFLIFFFLFFYFFSAEIYKFLVKPYSNAVIENNLDRRLIFTALRIPELGCFASTPTFSTTMPLA